MGRTPPPAPRTVAPYECLADALLRAEVAARPEREGIAGLATLVGELPSFDDGSARQLSTGALGAELARVRAAFHASLDGDEPFACVVANAALPADAAEVLAVLVAVELHPARATLVQRFTGALLRSPTLGLLRSLFPSPHAGVGAVAPDGALQRVAFVRPLGDDVFSSVPVRVEPGVLWAVLGDGSLDAELPDGVEVLEGGAGGAGAAVLLVPGTDPVRRRQTALDHAAADRLLVVAPPADDGAWRAVVREATLSGAGVLLELDDHLPAAARRWIERAQHLTWVLASRTELPVDDLPRRPWREERPPAAAAAPAELAAAFGPDVAVSHRLTAHQIELAARVLAGRPTEAGPLDDTGVTAAVRRLASGDLDKLAVRIRPRRSWTELVLPEEPLGQVRDVIDRYRHRRQVYEQWGFAPVPSAGVVAMFAGPPGTGKTLSAEIIAGELGLDLFRIDLASLVSKYIGETEKNLERIFRAAEGGTMVLLFDEADAVFGKRSEVSDSNDRYANVETSYLLQRLEAYEGVAVLTTNYASNIDEAFLRRIHVSVEFPQPDEPERLRLWRQSFPAGAPMGEVDLEFLAREFKLTGAAIRSVALAAAFRAAASDGPITMAEVVGALLAELRKQGRLTSAKAFGSYGHLLVP